MGNATRNWIVRQLTLGEFASRRAVIWRAVWMAVKIAMLAYGLWFRGIGCLSPVAVSAMSLLSPVTAVVLGWIFLGQKIQGMALMGLIVVLASVMSIQRALARQAAGAKTKKAP